MSSQNSYEQLGVTEASSFEEIQDARNRLFAQHQGDLKQLESIEAAYDAVLMDRLRLRQEGKIKVPDRIRFPEKVVPPPSTPPAIPISQRTAWLQRLIDTPSRSDVLIPAGVLTVLSAWVVIAPTANVVQLALILGMGASFYFVYRKERKLGRTVLLGLSGLVLGFLAGGALGGLLPFPLQVASVAVTLNAFVSIVTFFVLWLVSSFLR